MADLRHLLCVAVLLLVLRPENSDCHAVNKLCFLNSGRLPDNTKAPCPGCSLEVSGIPRVDVVLLLSGILALAAVPVGHSLIGFSCFLFLLLLRQEVNGRLCYSIVAGNGS